VTAIAASGGVRGRSHNRALTVPAKPGAHATLKARLTNGTRLDSLR